MRLFIKQYKLTISVFIALLFHMSGMLGILISDHAAWFVSNTPLNLWIMFVLLLWNQPSLSAKFWYFFIAAFVTGMLSEIIGVNTGLLFGSYFYGKVLGPGLMDVPFTIGMNWFVVVFCAGTVMTMLHRWLQHQFLKEGEGIPKRIENIAFVIDAALEPVAVKLGFWTWLSLDIPVFNYVCWFFLSAGLLVLFRKWEQPKANPFALHLLCIQVLFFLTLRNYLP
jgi:putative membrane protein